MIRSGDIAGCERDGEPLVRILGRSFDGDAEFRAADFRCDRSEPFTIAIARGPVEPEALRNEPVDHWALGGEPTRRSLEISPKLAIQSLGTASQPMT